MDKDPYLKDCIGIVLGNFAVIRKDECPSHVRGGRRKLSFYKCICGDCGTVKILGSDRIRNLRSDFLRGRCACIECRGPIRAKRRKKLKKRMEMKKNELNKNKIQQYIKRLSLRVDALNSEIEKQKQRLGKEK